MRAKARQLIVGVVFRLVLICAFAQWIAGWFDGATVWMVFLLESVPLLAFIELTIELVHRQAGRAARGVVGGIGWGVAYLALVSASRDPLSPAANAQARDFLVGALFGGAMSFDGWISVPLWRQSPDSDTSDPRD